MTILVETELTSFPAILQQVEKFQNSRSASWYRGSGDAHHSLIPALIRRSSAITAIEISKIEKSISNTFAQRSPPFVTIDFSSEWRTLFYMQHYGIPTRLLDWTESPFVGLYFALTSVKRDNSGAPLTDVALWLCDPIAWNQTVLSHITFKGEILDENFEEIKSYSPLSDVEQRATAPIMIFGTHNSPRIVAQRGVFALFGKGLDGMEKVYANGSFPKRTLQKLIIKKEYIDHILSSLHRKGIAESTIYPDLYGLSLEIKRSFGYH